MNPGDAVAELLRLAGYNGLYPVGPLDALAVHNAMLPQRIATIKGDRTYLISAGPHVNLVELQRAAVDHVMSHGACPPITLLNPTGHAGPAGLVMEITHVFTAAQVLQSVGRLPLQDFIDGPNFSKNLERMPPGRLLTGDDLFFDTKCRRWYVGSPSIHQECDAGDQWFSIRQWLSKRV
jgi:hypothetical protein